jgi:hypothetical protein
VTGSTLNDHEDAEPIPTTSSTLMVIAEGLDSVTIPAKLIAGPDDVSAFARTPGVKELLG